MGKNRNSNKPRFRSKSMENIRNPQFFKEIELVVKEPSLYEKINKYLRRFKEIRMLSKFTKIPPFYFLLLIVIFICFILLKLFMNNLSLSLATVYPLFMNFKALQNYDSNDSQGREEVIHWLKYWIFYSCLLNFESWFSPFLKQLYSFCKIFFILNCFPIESNILEWIYTIIFNFFSKYEDIILSFSKDVGKHLLEENNDDKKNNSSEDEDNNNTSLGGYLKNKIQEGTATLKFLKKIA